jgi:dTDP-4-dehydrorhamnose reductase
VCAWADLARTALDAAGLAGIPVVRISHTEWESPTVRPAYSPLASARAAGLGLTALRPWQDAVREYVTTHLAG